MTYPEGEIISAARDAWSRLQAHQRTSWADWLLIGRALLVARRDCMLEARANSPFGWKYNAAMGASLRQNGLHEISGQDRHKILECLAHEPEIEQWRATLTEVQRNRWNHPNSIWLHFSRAFRPNRQIEPRTTTPRHTVRGVKRNSSGMPTNPGQDMVRRVAAAIRENWSTDTFKLSAVAIAAVLRDPDLPELLNDTRAPNQARRTEMPASAELAM